MNNRGHEEKRIRSWLVGLPDKFVLEPTCPVSTLIRSWVTDRRPRTVFLARLTSGAFLPAAHRKTLPTKVSKLIVSGETSTFPRTNCLR
jgi:hypothetical protein